MQTLEQNIRWSCPKTCKKLSDEEMTVFLEIVEEYMKCEGYTDEFAHRANEICDIHGVDSDKFASIFDEFLEEMESYLQRIEKEKQKQNQRRDELKKEAQSIIDILVERGVEPGEEYIYTDYMNDVGKYVNAQLFEDNKYTGKVQQFAATYSRDPLGNLFVGNEKVDLLFFDHLCIFHPGDKSSYHKGRQVSFRRYTQESFISEDVEKKVGQLRDALERGATYVSISALLERHDMEQVFSFCPEVGITAEEIDNIRNLMDRIGRFPVAYAIDRIIANAEARLSEYARCRSCIYKEAGSIPSEVFLQDYKKPYNAFLYFYRRKALKLLRPLHASEDYIYLSSEKINEQEGTHFSDSFIDQIKHDTVKLEYYRKPDLPCLFWAFSPKSGPVYYNFVHVSSMISFIDRTLENEGRFEMGIAEFEGKLYRNVSGVLMFNNPFIEEEYRECQRLYESIGYSFYKDKSTIIIEK